MAAMEDVLGLALAFGRGRELAYGRSVSRSLGVRCGAVAAPRVEAVLLPQVDEHSSEVVDRALHGQCAVGAVLVLCVAEHAALGETQDAVRGLLQGLAKRGLVPPSVPAFCAQVHGVLGCTAAGQPQTSTSPGAVALVLLPAALAQVSVARDIEDLFREPGALGKDFLAASVVLDAACDGAFDRLPPTVFGGIARGHCLQVHGLGERFVPVGALVIHWLQGRAAGLSAAHVQTMKNCAPHGVSGEEGRIETRRRTLELIRSQHDAIKERTHSAPRAIMVFGCTGRDKSCYAEGSFEARALHEAHSIISLDGRTELPTLFGMLSCGEVGPWSSSFFDSDASDDSDEDAEEPDTCCHLQLAGSSPVRPSNADDVAKQPVHSCALGFSTVVGVLA